jgi:hypothetical protein
MTTVLEVYGRDEARETLLVGWNFPKGWVVQRTNIDVNSEAGTVATGDYQKGDSAVRLLPFCLMLLGIYMPFLPPPTLYRRVYTWDPKAC